MLLRVFVSRFDRDWCCSLKMRDLRGRVIRSQKRLVPNSALDQRV